MFPVSVTSHLHPNLWYRRDCGTALVTLRVCNDTDYKVVFEIMQSTWKAKDHRIRMDNQGIIATVLCMDSQSFLYFEGDLVFW